MPATKEMIDTPKLVDAIGSQPECMARVQPLFSAADVPFHTDATTAEVSEVFRYAGYDASVEVLENWIRSGMVPGVQLKGGRFAWTPKDIVVALVHCDTWRRFIPLHPAHIHKQSATELAEQMASKEGGTAFTDLEVFDVQAFLVMLERSTDANMRNVLATALRTKLRQIDPRILDK